jgi:hypothetical protein
MTLRLFIWAFSVVCFVGCEKRSGDAIVVRKEHIAAARPATNSQTTTTKPGAESETDDQGRPGSNDEITVESYVMKPEVRGTSLDPRALTDEQWLVKVRMLDGGRAFNVQTDQSRFERLKEGDKVRVKYRVGKYTNTVWAAEIEGTGKGGK